MSDGLQEMKCESIEEILRAMDAAWAQLRLAMNRAETEELRDQLRDDADNLSAAMETLERMRTD